MNEHFEIRLGSELDEKIYLWKLVKAYKSAKPEEIIETKSEIVNVENPLETKANSDNYLEQLKELKTVTKGIKDSTV